jgi:hypothetical protein
MPYRTYIRHHEAFPDVPFPFRPLNRKYIGSNRFIGQNATNGGNPPKYHSRILTFHQFQNFIASGLNSKWMKRQRFGCFAIISNVLSLRLWDANGKTNRISGLLGQQFESNSGNSTIFRPSQHEMKLHLTQQSTSLKIFRL